ncbi:FHA domain-containing protein [Oscillatoria sp. FACHB-1406]|uniref:FHA domain-containing protein n=1 Tax=Oscillatoria sp. FACHB-1406 TaxID=2692846 RepID=UPI0016857B0A|nr:FHA domain-containing protein [Oscillatoria sp. FACHB-1406]MBD2580674.1 FHA domain-containing protein [Oscillatoria sp. FACHB-1406]
MSELILEWQEGDRIKTQTIRDRQASKNPGTVRIGRDPLRCDILLIDPTVSGLHVEIFFNPNPTGFILRSLRPSNPPIIDGRSLATGEALLNPGSIIQLGVTVLKVAAIVLPQPIPTYAPTIIVAPSPIAAQAQPAVYGLECPHCHRISSYDRIDIGCPWCGTSLAAAASVVVPPNR